VKGRGPVAGDASERLWEEEEDQEEREGAEEKEKPENGVEAAVLRDDAADDGSDGLAEHANWTVSSPSPKVLGNCHPLPPKLPMKPPRSLAVVMSPITPAPVP
jgi:hypothetical protein